MKITEKIRNIMHSRYTIQDGEFVWHGEYVDGVATVTINGEKHNAHHILALMGVDTTDTTKYEEEHADLEELQCDRDNEDTGDGDSQSQE